MEQSRVSHMRKNEKTKKNKKWIIVVVLLLAGAATALGMLRSGGAPPEISSRNQRDMDAMLGQMPGKTQQDYNDVLNKLVEEGMFNISINSAIVCEGGVADLGIENIAQNRYMMQVDIYLQGKNGDKKVYESGIIAPGYYIERADVDTSGLAPGSYAAVAVFRAIDAEDETTEAGSSRIEITLTVKE